MSAVDSVLATEISAGGAPLSRHVDLPTATLDRLARSWIDVQQTRKALAQRELDERVVAPFLKAEQQLSRELSRWLRLHPVWPWLSQFPGLGGAHTALVIGRIGDPRRFPGQRCSEGHYLPPLYAVGAPCPVTESLGESEELLGGGASVAPADERTDEIVALDVCRGVMLPPRPTTGVRSLWHWAGLHAVDGAAPRKRKGVRADWEPRVRASVMQPGGIAEHIVRNGVPHYADVYRSAKERLNLRVAEIAHESVNRLGGANLLRAADARAENGVEYGRPLRPFEADRIARKVAAKAFLGDLLVHWKALYQ